MPVAASATRWAPDRTRSTRCVLNVLSPDPILLRPSFRFHDANSVPQPVEINASEGPDDPTPPLPIGPRLWDGRDLAGILLGLACSALTRLMGRVLVRHE